MSIDKSWIKKPRNTIEYEVGVVKFLDFAFAHSKFGNKIKCPCVRCRNGILKDRENVHGDLLWLGIMKTYTLWTCHGEDIYGNEIISDESDESDDMRGMIEDAFGMSNFNCREDSEPNECVPNCGEDRSPSKCTPDEPNGEALKFYDLLKDAETEIYPGCTKFSKLSFIVRLLHLKCLNGWSNKSFDMLLEFIKELLPDGEKVPKNHYESKQIIRDLGLDYEKIDACPNDCMLYWKEYKNEDKCVICGKSRWKSIECQATDGASKPSKRDSKIAAKVLRYFPLKPRLQRLFMSSKTAKDMRWHAEGRTKDDVLRHPADSKAWIALDEKYPSFGYEPRNVRLGLASDGFTPFTYMGTPHSTWPVILVPYNLPPWLCMKQTSFMLSLLIYAFMCSDEFFMQTMGPERHGRVRGYGLGPTPSSVFGPSFRQASSGTYSQVCNRLNNVLDEMEHMKATMTQQILEEREKREQLEEKMCQFMQQFRNKKKKRLHKEGAISNK